MKKHITTRLKEKIQILNNSWADNYISMKVTEKMDTEEAKKKYDIAIQNMKHYEKDIDILKQILKDETKTTNRNNSIGEE